MILLVFVAVLCLYVGVKVLSSEERNKVFNKHPIEVTDVKKYNKACGILIIAFTAAAEVTLFFMITTTGWISTLLTLFLIAEAYLVVVIYNRVERKLLKRR